MATRVWLGKAVPITQKDELAVTGTWAASDTATLTINGKALTVTVGSDTAVADIAEIIRRMVNGQSKKNDETRTQTGDKVGEFSRLTADSDTTSGTCFIEADDSGVPFTLSVSESTAGSGAITHNTGGGGNSVDPTGPSFFDDADNWSGDTVPVTNDVVVFDERACSDLKYNIAQDAVDLATIIITMGFSKEIGLSPTNTDDTSLPYDEYRATYFAFADDATVATFIEIGAGEGPGSQRIRLDPSASAAQITVYNTGADPNSSERAVAIINNDTDNTSIIRVFKGQVGVALAPEETARFLTVEVGHRGNVDGDATLEFGQGTTLTAGSGPSIVTTGGTVITRSNLTTVTMDNGTIEHNDQNDGTATTVTTINLRRGRVDYKSSGTLTTVEVASGSELDFSEGTKSVTVTNTTVHTDSILKDPRGRVTWTNGIDFDNCQPKDLADFDMPRHRTWTPSSI